MVAGSKKFVLIALFTALLIILVNLAWWFYYQRTEQILNYQLGRRLSAVAASGAAIIRPARIDSLLAGDIEAFDKVSSLLSDLQQSDSLADLFILDQDYHYLASSAVETDSLYFLIELNGDYIDSLFFFESDRPLVSESYRTGDLYLKSAFAPLRDTSGLVSAVLGVEANVDYFDVLNDLRHNLMYATVLSLMGGMLLGVVFLLLQRRISRAEQQLFLGQTHAYLGRMVAVVAHELRNPLMIMRASAERLKSKTEMAEAGYIVEEVDRLNNIVSGYLDFAKAGSSLLSGDHATQFSLTELLQGIKKHFFDKYRGEPIEWLGDITTEPIELIGHTRSLRQVLLNLLINSAEACLGAGKPIAVGLAVNDHGGSLEIRVIDHGPGMDRKQMRQAFEPFFTTKSTGSGLGLYLSKKIVVEMGGNLQIVSEPGIGTEFVINLPKKPKE